MAEVKINNIRERDVDLLFAGAIADDSGFPDLLLKKASPERFGLDVSALSVVCVEVSNTDPGSGTAGGASKAKAPQNSGK